MSTGERKQHSNTRNLIFDPFHLVSYLSQALTLEPGDVIFTGTPSGVSPVHPGDVMEMRIQGIGSLINPVAAEPCEQKNRSSGLKGLGERFFCSLFTCCWAGQTPPPPQNY